MTGLLTAAAVLCTLVLFVSATNAIGQATATDPQRRGKWGIATWTSQRSRNLNPHERRWQTALLSSRDNKARWGDLVAEIQKLQRLSNITPTRPVPAKPDMGWLDASIAELELITSKNAPTTNAGETTA